VTPFTVLSRTNLAGKHPNSFRIRFYANSACNSFRIRFYANDRGCGVSRLTAVSLSGSLVRSPFVFITLQTLSPATPLYSHPYKLPGRGIRRPSWRTPGGVTVRPARCNARSLRRPSVHPKSLIPAAPTSGFCLCLPNTGNFTVANFASKTWDMLCLIARRGPALHSRVCVKRNYSGE